MSAMKPENRPDNPNPESPPRLWAPWRLAYLENTASPQPSAAPPTPQGEHPSFLSAYWADAGNDAANHVLVRSELGMILLNRYPYANGHLLVALGEPRARLLDYPREHRRALWELVDTATELVERALEPQGVNTGINQGRAAGAGIPQHLHAHVLPRWGGDVNFITTIGQTRIIPGALDAMAARYRAVLPMLDLADGLTPR